MPLKPETLFYKRINSRIPSIIHRQKIGASSYNGTPDHWYSGNKRDIWVEFKWIEKVPEKGVDPSKLLSPLQKLWLNRRFYREKRHVACIIGSREGCNVLTQGEWNKFQLKSAFNYDEARVVVWLRTYLHDFSETSDKSGSSDEPNIQDLDDVAADCRNDV